MLEKMILLDTIDSVREFSAIAGTKDYLIELSSEDCVADAKSINEIFSLDLTKPIKMTAHCELVAELSRQIDRYIINK